MMSQTSDSSDLRLFAQRRDEAALARLIRRHADFVYSACLRQVRDPGLAEDAAQAVFILLAKKAGTIRDDAALIGWLFNVARYASRNALRGEKRRRQYEKEAALPSNAVTNPQFFPAEIDRRLDEALARLSQRDRQAVLLRFFRDHTHEQIAAAMGTSAHSAKMRVYRAIEKLRSHLDQNGTNLTPGILKAGLFATAKNAAPAGFADSATNAALGAHASIAATAISAAVAALLALRKIAVVAAVVAAALAIAGGVTLALHLKSPATTMVAATQRAIDPNWRQSFDGVYTLSDGQNLARVQQPYIGSRADFQQMFYHPQKYNGQGNGPIGSKSVGNTTDPPDAMDLEWDPQSHRVERITRINWGAWAFESLTVNLIGLRPDQFITPSRMTGITLAGDWVFRKGATPEEKLESFQKQLQKTPAAFVFEKKMIDRKVIVIRGQYARTDWPKGTITLQWTPDAPQRVSQGGDVGYFIRHMTMALGRPLINEWTGSEHAYFEFPSVNYLKVKGGVGDEQEARLTELLHVLGHQMHVELVPETRQIETFIIQPANPPTSSPAK